MFINGQIFNDFSLINYNFLQKCIVLQYVKFNVNFFANIYTSQADKIRMSSD